MKIYNANGIPLSKSTVVSSVSELPITKSAQHTEELMKANHVTLTWDDVKKYGLEVGDYIIPYPNETNGNDSRYPLRFMLLEPYEPQQVNEQKFRYEVNFQHPVMWLSKVMCVLVTDNTMTWEDAKKKTDWSYTGNAVQITKYIVDCINWYASQDQLFNRYVGSGWISEVSSDLVSSATVPVSALDIMSAAAQVANAFDCEYYFDFENKILRVGTITYGTKVLLKTGVNVGVASVSNSKEDYYNAFSVKGSTRNLSQPTPSGEHAQSTERLTLDSTEFPDSIMYTNKNGDIITKEQFVQSGLPMLMKELIFDDVYPKIELYVYKARERRCYLMENGEKVLDEHDVPIQYSKWYIRLAYPVYASNGSVSEWRDFLVDKNLIIDGQTLSIAFLANEDGEGNSLLAGQEFEVVYFDKQTTEKEEDDVNPEGFTAQEGDYRIVFKQNGNLIIPTTSEGGMYPYMAQTPGLGNDMAALYNIYVSDDYKKSAQSELKVVATRKVKSLTSNLNNYTFKSIEQSFIENNYNLHVGRAVTYNDGQDLNLNGTPVVLDTHVIKIVKQVDFPFQQEITVGNKKVKGSISSLRDKVDSIIAAGLGSGGSMTSSQFLSMLKAYGSSLFLRKDIDDVAKGLIDSLKGFQVGADFVSGLLGEGGIFRKEADGKTYIEADRLYVRLKAYFDEIEVKKYTHSGGNRIASKTGVKTVKVEWLDANGNVTENDNEVEKYRCYFRLSDDDGNTITNDWVVGDLARSQEFKDGTNGYWRAVVGVGSTADADGLGYIDLSKDDCLSGSDIPQAQDDIIQLGNKTNGDRQGAIIEYSTGANAPSYQIYQGINDYNLNGKNYVTLGYNTSTGKAELIVYGDAFIGNRDGSHIQYNSTTGNLTIKATIDAQSTIGNQSLEEYIQEHQTTWTEQEIETLITDSTSEQFADIDTAIDTLKKQADGAIETWFYNGEPKLDNEPASTWTTTELKDRHLGDLYYDNQSGYAYRFTKTGNTYSWNQISDSAVAKALSDAAAAQTTANSKRRIFFVTPTPPYEQGDLWVNATYPANNTYTDASNNRYYNDVLRCKTTKASGSFSISDWTLASKYTDDSKFNGYIDQLLNHTIISNPSDAQQVANTYNSVMQALNQGTIIEGGLVLSTLIGLRDSNNTVWAGISGAYDTQAKGNGIASWYGGAMVDWETLSDAQKQAATDGDYAKSLFRMDGTGYVASGNISWDANGRVTLKNLYTDTGKNIDQLLALFSIGGTIPTNAYITPAYPFSDLQVLTNSGNAVSVKDYLSLFIPHYNATTGELESIESPVPLWSRGEISALGYDDSGGGGGGGGTDLTAVWTTLTGNTGTYKDYQIHSGHLTSALANYALNSSLATVATSGSYNDLTNKPTIPAAQIQSDWNQTTTTAKDYIKNKPTIPAAQIQSDWNQTSTSAKDYIKNKPTNVSAFNNDANYVTSSSLTTTLASYATTSAMNTELAKYLPLTGGTMSNTNLVTNLNAELLDGVHASGLFTELENSGNNISLTIGGKTKTLQVAHADTSSAVGDLKYIFFSKNDNSGYPMLLLVSDVSEWYSKTSASNNTSKWFGMIGNLIAWRNGTMTRNFNCRFVAAVSYYNAYYRLQSDNSFVQPMVVSYDSKYYLAIKLTGSYHFCYFLGYTNDLLDTFIKLDYPSPTTLPSGVGIIYEGDGIPYQATTITASSTITAEGLLTASGNIKTASYIQIGDYRIVADTANNALKVVHKNGTTAVNFYATGENSALGVNTSGGGGGGDGASLAAVWTSLGSSTGTYGSSQINASHLTSALNGYATQSWVNQQGFLKSYTETDPVFKASAAHGITSADITSWNSKISNVQADWNATSGLAVILHKPTLATVATSGKYSDLTGTPTKVSDFTNDANYVTSSSLATTLASYATTSAMNTALSGYLPLTGGTLSGNLSVERTGTTDSSKVTVTNGDGGVSLVASTPNRGIWDVTSSKWLIGTNGEKTFLMDGYVGINTIAPSYQLHVNGNTYASRYYAGGSNYLAGDSTWLYFIVDSATPLVAGSTYVRRGYSDSDVTLGTSSYRWANLYSVLGNFSGQITSSVATGTSPLSVASTTLNTNLNADLLDGIHASGLFTALANSGNNISLTIGGTTKTLQVAHADTSSAVGSLKYIFFNKNDNSGYPMLLLVSDVSEWYSKTSTSSITSKWFGMIGNLIAWRSGNMERNFNCRFVAAVSYYNAYYRLQSDNSWVEPIVVSYDSKYYLALKLTGVGYYGYFLGYTSYLLDTFIKLDYPSPTTLPSGVEIIYEGDGIPYQATTITASSTITVEGLLTASGNISTKSYIDIGNYRIISTSDGLKVLNKSNANTPANFYATGEISALKTS